MFAELGYRVVAADYDPQANLTAMSLKEMDLLKIEDDEIESIYDVVAPLISKGSGVVPKTVEIVNGFALLPGDLELSNVEDALSAEWTRCLSDSVLDRERAFRVTTSLSRAASAAGEAYEADVVLVDVGPNLGAINRSALLGADAVVVPVAPDIFSLKGLTNVGRGLGEWRKGWDRRLENAPPPEDDNWPAGEMNPLGYVVSRFSTYAGERAAHFRRWINRVPTVFHQDVLNEPGPYSISVEEDTARLAWLKDYRSLMPMAQEARKPIFLLKPGDGAIGGHQQAVLSAYADFKDLAETVLSRAGVVGEYDLLL